jgi:hypothetical protein
MREFCELTTAKLSARQYKSILLITAEGTAPTPCHRVSIANCPHRVIPPHFRLLSCVNPHALCPEVIMPYVIHRLVWWPRSMRSVEVHTADGDVAVPVEMLDSPIGVFGGGYPWADMLEAEGRGGKTAIGFSASWNFDEAFKDATQQLRHGMKDPGPDYLWQFRAVETGARLGGIAGENYMYVVVELVSYD